jgi:predicted metal-dependent peptidase
LFNCSDIYPLFFPRYLDAADSDLKGMIYFTDGLGTFPEKAPDYETAFVFLQGDYEKKHKPEVPPWAVRIMLEEGDVLDV